MVKVKVCCIANVEEAALAIRFGASAIGLVGQMPSGPGPIPDEKIFEIARFVPSNISSFLLTCRTEPESIIEHHRITQTTTIQLVDSIKTEAYPKIRAGLGVVKLVQVVHVMDENSLEEALQVAPFVDAVLLDSGNPKLQIKELGGTGRTHNWKLSKKIVESVNVPVFLAGGLNAGNVKEAIETVQPYGLDLCSGVRTNGLLDPFKLEYFFQAVNSV